MLYAQHAVPVILSSSIVASLRHLLPALPSGASALDESFQSLMYLRKIVL